MTRHGRNLLVSLLPVLLAWGCAPAKKPDGMSLAPAPAIVKAPSPTDSLFSTMERLSTQAEDPDLTDEQAAQVAREMTQALATYVALTPDQQSDPKLQGALERMCDLCLQLQLDANAAPASPEQAGGSPTDDDLLHVTTFLPPDALKSTYQEVEAALQQTHLGFAIPTDNPAVLTYVQLFQTKLHDWFERALTRGGPYIPRMKEIFKDEGVPPSLVYLAIVESAFNPDAVSRARAVGMWQFIKGTAIRYNLKVDFWEDQRRDPEASARAAASYLKDLYGMFNDWQMALAAYNCGEAKIQCIMERRPNSTFWTLRDSRFLRRETREYVPAILAAILLASNPKAYGFTPPAPDPPASTAMVTIDEATDLRVIAKCAQVPLEEIQALNPSLNRLMTPPGPFELRIPASHLDGFMARLKAVPPDERIAVAMHKVTRGDTLRRIAAHYKVSTEAIRLANRMPTWRVRPGEMLVIPLGSAASDPELYAENRAPGATTARVYRVRRGDSLASISRRTAVPIDRLRELNNLTSNLLHPGQRLVLSEGEGAPRAGALGRSRSLEPRERVHHVRQGDTLWDLARRYGTSVDRICRANRISPSHRLKLGDSLLIP